MQKTNLVYFWSLHSEIIAFHVECKFSFFDGIGMTNFVLDENHHRIYLREACFFLRNIAQLHLIPPQKLFF